LISPPFSFLQIELVDELYFIYPNLTTIAQPFTMNFDEQKKKTLLAFTTPSSDNSPKGTIDIAIRDLCSLINSHPDLVTTSSCSGRIAIFESPVGADSSSEGGEGVVENANDNDNNNGKGHGRWLLTCHGRVTPSQVLNSIDLSSSAPNPILLKHEPLLLHIMCRSIPAASLLLKCALSAGFRESGITMSEKNGGKIIVAVRTTGLAMR